MDYRKTAQQHYRNHVCVWCGYGNPEVLEVAYVDHNNKNNKPSNLVFLCPTHHREYDLGLISTKMVLERRKFVETNPKADWSILIGGNLTKEELKKKLTESAKKAHRTRKLKEK
ncbi:HNH endonuclease protein [Marine Group I thaumarchaeote SCGC AAA799-E16]|uniref:HNH endonuclease protein n=3 Tax=Marine Group I TaxID=905826 RepID=A0A081RNW7_9ARCH|nr:HNH endonuclease protein [Marine Group I thaumarchaeote SCGC AAA799-N04]KER05484.1 HNH endonuclease protein [Marine Group I thaumarchaeote SCGC AAA799-E16]KFM16964.1 HNH endonuclease protein [Marine Group I thaumarchaeote SCGC RSA3]